MTWENITYKQFMKIKEITENTELSEDLQILEIVLLLYGDVPLSEMYQYSVEVYKLLEAPFPKGDKIDSTIKVNGREYTVTKDIEKIVTGQFIDYVSYTKNKSDFVNILSCFFIPKGHKYDDGYDMEQVKSDIGDLPIGTVNNYCFFFRKKWLKQQRVFLLYLMLQTLKIKGMPMRNKWKLLWAQAGLWKNMDYLTTYSLWSA